MTSLQITLAKAICILRQLHYLLIHDMLDIDMLQTELAETKKIICRLEQDLRQMNQHTK